MNRQLLEIAKVLVISASDVVIKGSKTNSFQFKLEKVHPGNINTPPHGTPVIGNSQGEGVAKLEFLEDSVWTKSKTSVGGI